MVEICTVVDACLSGGCAAKDLGPPCIQVRVEVDYCDGAIGSVDTAEQWERDGVVASKSDDAW